MSKMFITIATLLTMLIISGNLISCYKNCNPNTDKNCPCPPGVCGPYPDQDQLRRISDAGLDH